MSFSGESGLREVGLGGIHPLTQRYATSLGYKMSIQGIVSLTWSDILQLQQGVYLSVEPES
ncbi:GNAT family N-acetyltransferase, partial [Vibrio vulnificus]|nr:GNAT family N-acetyltransferase [Vibrio vulnificus]